MCYSGDLTTILQQHKQILVASVIVFAVVILFLFFLPAAEVEAYETSYEPVQSIPIAPKALQDFINAEFGEGSIMSHVADCESGDRLSDGSAKTRSARQFNNDGTLRRGISNSDDVGAFMINEKYHLTEAQKLGIDITTTEGNVEYAAILYKAYGLAPWSWSSNCWSRYI